MHIPLFRRLTRLTVTLSGIGVMMIASASSVGGADDGMPAGFSANAALTVATVRLQPVEIRRALAVNGTIHAWQEVIIAAEVGGYRVDEVLVDVGDKVSKGQELVTLSTRLLEAEVAARRAAIKQREAELMNAQAALKRAQALSAKSVLSESDLDRLNSESLAAEARLESARADLETSRLRLQYAHVSAPDDGVITSRSVSVGQIAQAGSEMLRLLRQSRIEWRGEVPEARLSELSAGQPVRVVMADGLNIQGKIRVVAPTVTNANRTGLVYVDIESNPQVRPGMFARGEIEVTRNMALAAPLGSIVSTDGYTYVFVVNADHTVDRRRVETGTVQDDLIELVSGVKAGDVLVERGAGFLKDGDVVNVSEAR